MSDIRHFETLDREGRTPKAVELGYLERKAKDKEAEPKKFDPFLS